MFIILFFGDPSLASDTISSLSLPSDYRSVSLGGVEESQDIPDATSSSAAFGNMMFIDFPIGVNKSKHYIFFSCWIVIVLTELCGFMISIVFLSCQCVHDI